MRGHNYISGEWTGGGTATTDVNPSNLSDIVGEYAQASVDQTKQAIAGARQAFDKWSQSSIQLRADILDAIGTEILARKEELGTLLSREEGKTRPEGIGEAATSSSSSQARRCARTASSYPRCVPGCRSRSRASRSASSG
jgi:aldehyde dehydrogenase (NAD+)